MNEFLEKLWEAYHSEFGIEVPVSDVEAARRKFYEARKLDPMLSSIGVTPSRLDPTGAIWLVKKGVSDGEGTS